MNNRHWIIYLMAALFSLSCQKEETFRIVLGEEAGPREQLAARELGRYLYQTTRQVAPVDRPGTGPLQGTMEGRILIGKQGDAWTGELEAPLREAVEGLKEEDFLIRSYRDGLLIIGGSGLGALYGAFHFASEYLGVGFYLHGDVIPDRKMEELSLDGIDVVQRPLFAIRGILPFHDFPEGPDWWDLEGYKAVLAQLPKMKMNFIGLHCYPQVPAYPSGYCQAEPLVWIGREGDVNEDGTVRRAYPALHFQTGHDTWGYAPMETSLYSCGASMLFEEDHYGASYMTGISHWPHTEEENLRMFNDHGALIADAFTFARELGVKTCIGTEVPLTIPIELKPAPGASGDQVTGDYYRGLFTRIQRTHPLDYYWLWTAEYWTWGEIPDAEVDRVNRDMLIALEALRESGASFQLATCGWVLGPARNRAEFDNLLPREVPFSCINREVGWDYIEPAFRDLEGRPKWAIPWMEDDPALISPQLWAGRMRMDAVDALEYGCNGLIGIHWRTRNISPNVSALAKAAWEMGTWSGAQTAFPERDLPVGDFYVQWAENQFGSGVAGEAAQIFTRLDGGDFYDRREPYVRDANLYRSTTWIGGPGGIHRNPAPWSRIGEKFRFIEELEKLEPSVTGEGNRERFGYWLNSFRFERSMAHLGCTLGALDSLVRLIESDLRMAGADHPVVAETLLKREESARLYEEVMGYMLETVSTTGELGMIANLEGHNRTGLRLLTLHDSLLEARSGTDPGKEFRLPDRYHGRTRIILPVERTLLEPHEDLELNVLILSEGEVGSAVLHWRPFGARDFQTAALEHAGRGVYSARIRSEDLGGEDFEYFIRAVSGNDTVVFPPTAPEINRSVVICPE